MILIIDNYDSFSYNLYQLIGAQNPEIMVVKNDELSVEQIKNLRPSHIVLSPGPKRPCDAGVCVDVVKQLHGRIPILGVCLGHQVICEAFGATVSYAKEMMHGKSSEISVEESVIFKGLADRITVARYHSLAAIKSTIPNDLKVTAIADNGEVMAVEHVELPVFGVQFHPESILTQDGETMMRNFLKVVSNND